MSILDWIILLAVIAGVFWGAFEIIDALRFDLFAQEMKCRRPQAHKFN